MDNDTKNEGNQRTIQEFASDVQAIMAKGFKDVDNILESFNGRILAFEDKIKGLEAQFEKVLSALNDAIDTVPKVNN